MNGLSSISTLGAQAKPLGLNSTVTGLSNFNFELQKAAEGKAKQLREVTAQFVATAFLMPMLKQVREDPFKTEMFHGGQGEKVFGAQLDQTLADRIAQSPAFPLVDRLYDHLAHRLNLTKAVDTHG